MTMKKAPFIIILILTFMAEAFVCFFMVTRIKDLKTDPVKVNAPPSRILVGGLCRRP